MKQCNSRDFFLGIKGNEIYAGNGDFILGYKINYPEKYSQKEIDFKNHSQEWFKFCRNLPTGAILMKSDLYLKHECDGSVEETTYLHTTLNTHFRGRTKLNHTGYLFIISTQTNTLNNNKCVNPFNILDRKTLFEEEEKIEYFRDAVEQAKSLLNDRLVPLTEDDILQYSDFYFNGFQEDYFTSSEIGKNSISADNKEIGIFYIPNEYHLPDTIDYATIDNVITPSDSDFKFFQGYMDNFGVTAKYNHLYNQVIYIDDNQIHINTLDKQQQNLNGFRALGSSNAVTAEKIKVVLDEAANSENFRLVRGFTSVTFWSESKNEFKILSNQISSAFKEKNFKPVLAISYSLKEVFLNSFFTNLSCLSNSHLYLTTLDVATSLFILNTTYKDDEQGIYFSDRIYNTPVKYDFWDFAKKRKVSRNFAIIADTGSGKSFFSMNLFFQLFYQRVKLVILDMGGSYVKMAHLFPPDKVAIINLKKGEPIGDNPFAVYPKEKITSKIESVADFVHLLLYKSSKPTELQDTSLRKILFSYYNDIDSNHCFETFYNYVKHNESAILEIADILITEDQNLYFNVKEFLHLGSEYIGNGIYARMLQVDQSHKDAINSIYTKSLIIYELDDIAEDAQTVQIALMAIKETIRRVVWEDRTTPAIIHFEEFAKQLRVKEILLAVEYYTQTARKYNGSVGIVLQSLSQLPDEISANSILENIETYIFLNKNAIDYAKVKIPSLTTHAQTQLLSLQSNFSQHSAINYSEVYIHTKKAGGLVYRVETSPEAYLAFQTEGDLYELILYLFNKSGDMQLAIEMFIKAEKKQPNIRELLREKYSDVKDDSLPIKIYEDYIETFIN